MTATAAFATAHTSIRNAITALRGIGKTEDNGDFGQVIRDLERICQVCIDREAAERPVVVAKPVEAPVKAKSETVKVAAQQGTDGVKVDQSKSAVATPADEKAALLAEFGKLGGNVAFAKRWGIPALKNNIAKLRGKANASKPAANKQTTNKAAVAKNADPVVPGCFDANGKPLTLSQVMSALDKLPKANKAA